MVQVITVHKVTNLEVKTSKSLFTVFYITVIAATNKNDKLAGVFSQTSHSCTDSSREYTFWAFDNILRLVGHRRLGTNRSDRRTFEVIYTN